MGRVCIKPIDFMSRPLLHIPPRRHKRQLLSSVCAHGLNKQRLEKYQRKAGSNTHGVRAEKPRPKTDLAASRPLRSLKGDTKQGNGNSKCGKRVPRKESLEY